MTDRRNPAHAQGDGLDRLDGPDPLAARARAASDAVRDQAAGRPTNGVGTIARRARRRDRTPGVVAAAVVVLLAVPLATWLASDDPDLRIGDVEVADQQQVEEPRPPLEDGPDPDDEGPSDDGSTAAPEGAPDPPIEPDDDPTSDAPSAPSQEGADTDADRDLGTDTAPRVPPVASDFGTDPVETDGFPFGGGEPLALTDVRLAEQDGFDRLVLEFAGDGRSPYRVAYIDAPITEDGSGAEVGVEGEAFLEVRLTAASGVVFDLDAEDGFRVTYDGPTRLRTSTNVVTEVVRTGDFEATLTFVVGLDRTVPFTVAWLENPDRLVIDLDADTRQ